MSNKKVVRISWPNVVRRFNTSYESVFKSNKKAHFDCLPQEHKVIDGARGRWCNLLLLDSLIYFLTASDFIFVSRRAFNQQRVLYEAIMEEIRSLNHGSDVSVSECDVFLYDLDYPWNNIRNLKFFLLQDPPAKSKPRFKAIIDLLCDNSPLSSADLNVVFHQVIMKTIELVEEFDRQIAVGNCPKITVKQENFKSSFFYKQCAAQPTNFVQQLKAPGSLRPRSSSAHSKASAYSHRSHCDDSDEDYVDDEEEEEEYPCKRRHSAELYPTEKNVSTWWLRERRVADKRNRQPVRLVHHVFPDMNEETHSDDYGMFMMDDVKYSSDSLFNPVSCDIRLTAVLLSAPSSSSTDGDFSCSQMTTSTDGVVDADMAECFAAILRSDSMESLNLNLFDDSLDDLQVSPVTAK